MTLGHKYYCQSQKMRKEGTVQTNMASYRQPRVEAHSSDKAPGQHDFNVDNFSTASHAKCFINNHDLEPQDNSEHPKHKIQHLQAESPYQTRQTSCLRCAQMAVQSCFKMFILP